MQFYHDHRMDVTGRNVWIGSYWSIHCG
jgi:hypothetical protein